ncbi:hypothetical protein HMPREF0972_00053 [Actinomyces sp. oral taxon 848 str. F0332]|nr:hypothetical protein HMPREF0972_00053 [Actinomyces sp. oral taxon 848 str. F0332]
MRPASPIRRARATTGQRAISRRASSSDSDRRPFGLARRAEASRARRTGPRL